MHSTAEKKNSKQHTPKRKKKIELYSLLPELDKLPKLYELLSWLQIKVIQSSNLAKYNAINMKKQKF
jgi:hypothetical protein